MVAMDLSGAAKVADIIIDGQWRSPGGLLDKCPELYGVVPIINVNIKDKKVWCSALSGW